MSTPSTGSSKYHLKSLHQEIDLYDRKLAHLDKFTPDASGAERTKMLNKRNLLAKAARQLVADGIEFDPKDLPRSFQTEQTS